MFSRIPNLRIHDVLFSFKGAAMCLFVKINSFSNIFDLIRKILPCLKENGEKIMKNINESVNSEFVKACHEHVNLPSLTFEWYSQVF